jgi:hypothetical protein
VLEVARASRARAFVDGGGAVCFGGGGDTAAMDPAYRVKLVRGWPSGTRRVLR